MLLYFFIWFLLFIFSFLEMMHLRKSDAQNVFFVLVLFLFILSFIRWETGTDWDNYYNYFQRIYAFNQYSGFEYGFSRLNEIIKLSFDSYTLLLFVCALIVFICQTKAITTLSPYPLFALFFLWSISFAHVFFVRQTIATALLMYSVVCLAKNKSLLFFLFVGIAFLFHRSSLVFVLAYWVYRMNLNNMKICCIVLLSLLLSVVISSLITSLLPFMGNVVQYKLETYLKWGEEGEDIAEASSLQSMLIRGILNKGVILLFFMFYSWKNRLRTNKAFCGMLNLYVLGVFIYFVTAPVSLTLVRLSFAYDTMQVFLLPMVLNTIGFKSRILWFFLWSLFLAARFYVTLFGSYPECFIPYKTVFGT